MVITTQAKKIILVSAGFILAAILPYILVPGSESPDPAYQMTSVEIFTVKGAAGFVAAIFLFIGYAFIAFAGFERSVPWAMAILFIPFAALVFLYLYWRSCRDAFPFLALGAIFTVIRLLA